MDMILFYGKKKKNWKTLKAGTTGTGTGPHHSLLTALTTRFQVVDLFVVRVYALTRDKRIVILYMLAALV